MTEDRDDELQREIRSHLDLEAEDRAAEGLSEAEARNAARRAFGNVTRTREDVRAVWTRAWLGDLRQDVGYARRTLVKNPGFAAVAILTLALGIGANTAVFSLVHAVMLRPLPFAEPDRLVVVWEDFSARGGPMSAEVSPGNFRDWKEQNRVFDDMAAVNGRLTFNLTGRGDPERLSGARVTGNLFSMLGLTAIAGRTILPADDRPGAHPVVVVSEGLWRRRFGGDATLVGQSITLDDVPHVVAGIVPGDFQFPTSGTDVWLAGAFTPEQAAARTTLYLYVIARLKPGVSLPQAQNDMSSIASRLAQQFPGTNAQRGVNLVPLHDQYTGGSRQMLTLLLWTVAVVLLIACVNVAHLLLARGTERRREIALRGALGAGRGRVLRQLLTESVLLSGMGAIAGITLSAVALRFLTRLIPENFPEGMTLGLNPLVLLFTAVVAVLTSIAFGVGPSVAASRLNLHDALKPSGTRGSTRREGGIRGALVVAEVSMTVVLLIAAGLLLRSYSELSSVDLGFQPRGLLVAETPLSPSRYRDSPRRSEFVARTLERLGSVPGVVSAGYVNYSPLTFPGGRSGLVIEGRPAPRPDEVPPLAINRAVSPGYLETLGVPLLRGRHFDERDGPETPTTVIINETMAKMFWGGEDPIGRRIRFGPSNAAAAPWVTVIGVVGDIRQIELEVAPEPELYLPLNQLPSEAAPFVWPRYLVVRTSGEPTAIAADVRKAVAGVDPNQPVSNVRSMEQVIGEHLTDRSTQLTLIGVFSALALLLASVGLYGVLAYAVAQQTPEIGLRMALGASRTDVVRPLVRRTLLLSGAGVLLGLVVGAATTRAVASLLYEVSPTDPVAFATVAILLMGVAGVACWAPARRATRIDPLVALRTE